MLEDWIPADKTLRKKTFVLAVVFILGLLLVAPCLNGRLSDWRPAAAESPEAAARQFSILMQWLLGFTALLVSAACTYLIAVAIRVLKTERYPPPGMKVIRDTRLCTGRKARITAYVLMVNSVILILLVSLIFLFFLRLAEKLEIPPKPGVRSTPSIPVQKSV